MSLRWDQMYSFLVLFWSCISYYFKHLLRSETKSSGCIFIYIYIYNIYTYNIYIYNIIYIYILYIIYIIHNYIPIIYQINHFNHYIPIMYPINHHLWFDFLPLTKKNALGFMVISQSYPGYPIPVILSTPQKPWV